MNKILGILAIGFITFISSVSPVFAANRFVAPDTFIVDDLGEHVPGDCNNDSWRIGFQQLSTFTTIGNIYGLTSATILGNHTVSEIQYSGAERFIDGQTYEFRPVCDDPTFAATDWISILFTEGGETGMTPVVMDATVASAGKAIITDLSTNLLSSVPGVVQVALPWIIGIAVLIFIVKFGRAMIGH